MNATSPLKSQSTCQECKECKKSFKNILLHVVKTHKKFICCACKQYKPIETAISDIGDNNKGKFCKNAMCEDCWT